MIVREALQRCDPTGQAVLGSMRLRKWIAGMKPFPNLLNDFILNESEYHACKAWLADANEETICHPLDNPELEMQRQHIKRFMTEYEQNWRHSGEP